LLTYSTNTEYFNMISELIQFVISFDDYEHDESISPTDSDRYSKQAEELINKNLGKYDMGDKLRVTEAGKHAIINSCKEKSSLFFTNALISKLDAFINIDDFVNGYNAYNVPCFEEAEFFSLNDNYSDTGIVVLPLVSRTRTSVSYITYSGKKRNHIRQTALSLKNRLTNCLQNIFFVEYSKIKKHIIKNIVLKIPDAVTKKGYIDIAASPYCCRPLSDVLSINYYEQSNGEETHGKFIIEKIINSDEIKEVFLKVFKYSQDNNIDVILGPEILCTEELFAEKSGAYNNLIIENTINSNPYLIIPGSYWSDNMNRAPIYYTGGRCVGIQQKHRRFKQKKDDKNYTEDLNKSSEYEILLIHIPGWGRISVLICKDFIDPNIRTLLVEELQATLILCPSFSPSMSSFENAEQSLAEYDASAVIVNSCTALSESKADIDFAGEVFTPTVSSIGGKCRLNRECNGICESGCVFKIRLPLDRKGESDYEERGAEFEQFIFN